MQNRNTKSTQQSTPHMKSAQIYKIFNESLHCHRSRIEAVIHGENSRYLCFTVGNLLAETT